MYFLVFQPEDTYLSIYVLKNVMPIKKAQYVDSISLLVRMTRYSYAW